jgi:TonB family protein
VQGRTFTVRFTVGVNGRVVGVDVEPRIGDTTYRKRFVEVMRRFRFTPATGPDGNPVQGEAVLVFTL